MVADMRSRVTFFVIGLSRLSSKRGRGAIVIGDMDILRLMVYVQQVEKEKIRDKKKCLRIKELSHGTCLDIKRVMSTCHPSNRNRRDLLHQLPVHLHLRTKVSTISEVSELNLLILKVASRKGVVSLMHVLSVVRPLGYLS